jgi:hypothetical protein
MGSGFPWRPNKDVPSYVKEDSGHNAMLLLLKLYEEYLERTIVIDEMGVTVLANCLPLSGSFNIGAGDTEGGGGYQMNGSHPDTLEGNLTGLCSIVPEEYFFTSFVRKVMDGTENVDEYPGFKEHMEEEFDIAVNEFRQLPTERLADDPFTASYQLPYDYSEAAEKKKRGERAKSHPAANEFQKVVRSLYVLDGTRMKGGHVLDDFGPFGSPDLGVGFEVLHRAGCIKSVSFDVEKLKKAYTEGELFPDDPVTVDDPEGIQPPGFVQRILQHVEKNTEKRKAVRRVSAAEARSERSEKSGRCGGLDTEERSGRKGVKRQKRQKRQERCPS